MVSERKEKCLIRTGVGQWKVKLLRMRKQETVSSVSLCSPCSLSPPQEYVSFWRFCGDKLLFVMRTRTPCKEGVLYLIAGAGYDQTCLQTHEWARPGMPYVGGGDRKTNEHLFSFVLVWFIQALLYFRTIQICSKMLKNKNKTTQIYTKYIGGGKIMNKCFRIQIHWWLEVEANDPASFKYGCLHQAVAGMID